MMTDPCPNCKSTQFTMDMMLTGNHFCTTDEEPKRLDPLEVKVDFEQGATP